MPIYRNVGGIDRFARLIFGTLLPIVAFSPRRGRLFRILAGGVAAVAVETAFTAYCPVNRFLGIDTSRRGASLRRLFA